MNYYQKTIDQAYHQVDSIAGGLADSERRLRLKKYGLNEIKVKGEPFWRKLIEPFADVFMLVLVVAGVLSLTTGHTLDAIIVVAIIAISAIIYYVQRLSTERVLRALKQHDRQRVDVLVDGQVLTIDASQLVPGDTVILAEGEKVPADGRIIEEDDIRIDESMLTGESLPVNKNIEVLSGERPIYEQSNMLFQGSFVVSGRGSFLVTATAMNTEYGKIAELAKPSNEVSPAQAKINSLITKIVLIITILVVLVFGLVLLRGIELSEALRYAMSIAVSAVPEGLILATTVILVLGMRRLARHNALARSMRAIENIGIVTTIASDKTGTLTKNELTVQELWHPDHSTEDVIYYAKLSVNDTQNSGTDPLDIAILNYSMQHSPEAIGNMTLSQNFSFDQSLAMSGNIWQSENGFKAVIKGAPEQLIKHSYNGDLAGEALANKALERLSGMGYRVVAIAQIESVGGEPDSLAELPFQDMKFIGLVGIADELRPGVSRAISDARAAGISIRMITGDHAETAFAIGKQLGLAEDRSQVMDCRDIGRMTDEELASKVSEIRVFARVIPEAKHRILGILKKKDITAMTGDGVNDVPALNNAHVGIAMGAGSQIAKEASDIVLLDNNFTSIVEAVRSGRIIFDNIRRMLFYLLSTNLGEVMVVVTALLIGMPIPLVAVQILWINLVTDTAFVIPLGLEKAEENVMKRPPRRVNQPILDRHMVIRLLLIAATMSVATLLVFGYMLDRHGDLAYAQSVTFMVLVVAQWANALNSRSEFNSIFKRMRVVNRPMIVGAVIAILLQGLAMFGPLQEAMHVVPVDLVEIVWTSLAMFALVIIVGELHKLYTRQAMASKKRPTQG